MYIDLYAHIEINPAGFQLLMIKLMAERRRKQAGTTGGRSKGLAEHLQ